MNFEQQQALGQLLTMSGDRVLAPAGQQMGQLANAGQQRQMLNDYYQGMLRQQAANADETKRWHDMQMQLGREGNENRLAMAELRGMLAGAGNNWKPVPTGDREKLVRQKAVFELSKTLEETFNPEWTSKFPGSGVLRETVGKTAFAPGEWQDYAKWRGDLEGWVEALRRHDLFGSAFTSSEGKFWLKQAVSPDASPEQVVTAMQRIRAEVQRQIMLRAQSLRPLTGDEQLAPFLEGLDDGTD